MNNYSNTTLKILITRLSILLIILILCGCDNRKKFNDDYQEIDISLKSNLNADTREIKIYLLDPKLADVTIKKFGVSDQEGIDFDANDSSAIKGLFFPKIEFEFTKADFVKILRCPEEHKNFFKQGLEAGIDYDQFVSNNHHSTPLGYEKYQRFWNSAEANYISKCVYASTHMVRKNFFDLSAPSGRWYYLVNPCVSKDSSKTGEEQCSANVKKTPSFDFESTANQRFYDIITDLGEFEGRVASAAHEMKRLAIEISIKTIRCEQDAMVKAHNQAISSAWKSLAAMVGSFVIGSVFSLTPGFQRHLLKLTNGWINPDSRSRYEKYQDYRNCPDIIESIDKFDQFQEKIEGFILDIQAKRLQITAANSIFSQHNVEIMNYYSTALSP